MNTEQANLVEKKNVSLDHIPYILWIVFFPCASLDILYDTCILLV